MPLLRRPASLTCQGSRTVWSANELVTAVNDTNSSAPCLILLAASEYDLAAELHISRNLTVARATPGGQVVLRAVGFPHRVLRISDGTNVTLEGLVITGGDGADAGGGIRNNGSLTLEEVVVFNNTARSGGGIFNSANVTLVHSVITRNTGTGNAGGIRSDGGIANLKLLHSAVSYNRAPACGGVFNNGGSLTMLNATIASNSADPAQAGGILNTGSTTSTDSTVINNTAVQHGGGIYNNDHKVTTLINTTVVGNTADAGGGVYNGRHGNVTLIRSRVINNTAYKVAGVFNNFGQVAFIHSILSGNNASNVADALPARITAFLSASAECTSAGFGVAPQAYGGLRSDANVAVVELRHSIISYNTAPSISGAFNNHGTFTMLNSTIANNTDTGNSSAPRAGLANDGTLIMQDSSVTGNSVTDLVHTGTAVYLLPAPFGRYVEGAVQCVQQMCTTESGASKPCQFQYCPGSFFGNPHALRTLPQGSMDDFPPKCQIGFYGDRTGNDTQISMSCAGQCPSNTSTLSTGSIAPTDCVCQTGFFDDQGRADAIDAATGARRCFTCPRGFDCDVKDATTYTADVLSGFWRPTLASRESKPCPHPELCVGGRSAVDLTLELNATCKPTLGGAYCTDCVDGHRYLNTAQMTCEACITSYAFIGALLGGLVVVMVAVALSTTKHALLSCKELILHSSVVIAFVDASKRVQLPVKAKLLLGFSQIVAQMRSVYQIAVPSHYQSFTSKVFSPLRLQLFGWIPGLHMSCLGIRTLHGELVLYSLLPVAIVLAAFGASLAYKRSLLPALPFVLRFTYVFWPSISSFGFRTLGQCDCFEQIDGTPALCFLPADYSIQCNGMHAPNSLITIGAVAVMLYGIGVPTLYAGLLFACRDAICREVNTPLSTALTFLHAALHPWAWFWPLVEALRAFFLVGFLALIKPGSLFQLLCGLLVAVAFQVLQLWCAPYRTVSNNLLAMAINLCIVLNFVSSLGVQINAMHGGDIDPLLLSVALYTTVFAVFPLTLLTFLTAVARPIKGAQRLSLRLEDEQDATGTHAASPAAPQLMIARFGQVSINAPEDVPVAPLNVQTSESLAS